MLVIDQIERASSKDLVESIEETSYQETETEPITYYDFNKSQLPSSVLPMRNQNFIEKDQILERLSNTFFNQNKQIIVINSFSGTGKTTIAIEYGYKFIENNNHHHYAYMIKSDGLKLELEFESLAKKFKFKKDETSFIKNLKDILVDLDEKILFIFDNCEHYLNIERFIIMFSTLKNVYILITTRDAKLIDNLNQQTAQQFDIEPFNQKETFQFLRNSLGSKLRDTNDLNEIATVFGFLNKPMRPILLDKITAFIKLKIGDTIKLKLFLNDLKTSQEFKTILNQNNYKLFEVLIKKEEKAWQVLKYISLLDPDFIPMNFFKDILNCDQYDFDKSVRSLRELSLIKIEQTNNDYDDDGLKIHREIHQEAQEYLSQNENEFNEIKQSLINNLINALQQDDEIKINKGWNKKRYYYNFKIITKLVEESAMTNKNEFTIIYALFAKYLYRFEINYLESLNYYENSLKMTQNQSLNDRAELLTYVGMTYGRLGKKIESLENLEKSLSIKKNLSVNDLSIADTLNEMAIVYNDLARYKESLKCYQESLEIRRSTDNQSKISSNLNNIGLVYYRLGKYEEALDYYMKALAIDNTLNDDNVNLRKAVLLNNIGMVQCEFGNYMKSLDNYNQSLEICRKLYETDEHSRIGITLANIAYSYLKVPDLKAVYDLSEKSLKIFSEITDNHYVQHGRARAYRNLAYYYIYSNEFDNALECSQICLDNFRKIFYQNDNSLNVAESLYLIGLAEFFLGFFNESKLNLNESLKILMNILENNDQNLMVAQVYEGLALHHEYSNEIELALNYRQKACDIKNLFKLKYKDF